MYKYNFIVSFIAIFKSYFYLQRIEISFNCFYRLTKLNKHLTAVISNKIAGKEVRTISIEFKIQRIIAAIKIIPDKFKSQNNSNFMIA